MSESDAPGPNGCCGSSASGCVFAKALQARASACELSVRRSAGEREVVDCRSVVARINCATLAALLHERARFALRLPAPGQPMLHAKVLKLHCGGLIALQHALGVARPDVHGMVGLAQERHGSLTELPWQTIVRELVDWQPHRRRRPLAP